MNDKEKRSVSRGAPIGRYLVLSELGRGGAGLVVEALDPELDRRVALKLPTTDGGRQRRELAREARVLAKSPPPRTSPVRGSSRPTRRGSSTATSSRANVHIGEGRVRVGDFGLAQIDPQARVGLRPGDSLRGLVEPHTSYGGTPIEEARSILSAADPAASLRN